MNRSTNFVPPFKFLTIVLVAFAVALIVNNHAWIHLLVTSVVMYMAYLMVQSRYMIIAFPGMLIIIVAILISGLVALLTYNLAWLGVSALCLGFGFYLLTHTAPPPP